MLWRQSRCHKHLGPAYHSIAAHGRGAGHAKFRVQRRHKASSAFCCRPEATLAKRREARAKHAGRDALKASLRNARLEPRGTLEASCAVKRRTPKTFRCARRRMNDLAWGGDTKDDVMKAKKKSEMRSMREKLRDGRRQGIAEAVLFAEETSRR